jgi:amino acid adenylation domain-containing protein
VSTIHDLIWEQARRRPDAVAVEHDDVTGTYRQLTDAADAAARRLRAAGVGPEQVVGVSYPRSVDGLVALLGVLRAGAAVLYLDPEWPAERLEFMLARCDVPVVLSASHGLAPRPTKARPSTDADRPLCYVVFTSGSTGTPKGVQVEHPAVLNMAVSLAELFAVREGTRMLQFAAWSWDAAMCEILVTLGAGGTLVIAPAAARSGGDALADFLRDRAVEVVTLTPSVLDATPVADLPALHTVVSVGEACHPALVRRWTAPHRRVLTGYGPTEATVAVTVGTCIPDAPIHIGAPLPGVRIRVADAGELLVGGVGLARGYVGEPELTALRFVTDASGERWYRTGDLVRPQRDGTLAYVGRRDEQVKLRGYRVELGEVEAVLSTAPGVRSCAVAVVADRVDEHARRRLPDFMVPGEVRAVAALPLTPNGKLDRAAVTRTEPAPGPARNTVPDRVSAIVDRLLRARVAPDANIFDVGGHSLLAAELSVSLGEEFGVDLRFHEVILNPTPAALARLVAERAGGPERIGAASSTPA